VPPRRRPTPRESRDAAERLLLALEAGTDIFDALDDIRPLHPRRDTFPGEVFLGLAARAMAEGGVSPATPISEAGLVDARLPECVFPGRDDHKIRYAPLAAAAIHGGVEVDLLEEVVHWGTDDFWSYAGLAAVVWIRAVAASRGMALDELCQRLRAQDLRRGS
jgi:hypothetical protein